MLYANTMRRAHRSSTPRPNSPKLFASFARPTEQVFGAESARDALIRFTAEVEGLLSEADGTVAVISHGRVMSLYVASCARLDAFEVWQRLTLPSLVVLDVTRRRVEHLAASV